MKIPLIADLVRRSFLQRILRQRKHRLEYRRWLQSGRTGPTPHLLKQKLIRRYSSKHNCRTLVETGTYRGDMMLAMQDEFHQLYSIELQPELHARAARMFRNRPHIRLLQGDSGERIGDVLAQLDEPAVFWLDGHYSGGVTAKADLNTPVVEELERILHHHVNDHIVLIDDARLFDGTHDYPTVGQIRDRLDGAGRYNVVVEDDVIAITRRAA